VEKIVVRTTTIPRETVIIALILLAATVGFSPLTNPTAIAKL